MFTNPTSNETMERVDVAGWAGVEDLLGELLPREGQEVVLSVPSLDVRVLIVER